ncbi:hypothetical protein HNR46_002885 [Haloferula luteola]|uniref:Uncharacterized protein n=1 Tax=Haloferula luteola TaxID=595692 RepID=A0A840V2W6_9BACT|nr:hypothetical protein [Haloferula luteola]MBB5352637.1 hypothetical protein [Haloferula luteola]
MSHPIRRAPATRYAVALLTCLLGILLLSLAINLVVDPFRILASPLQSSKLDAYREIESQLRTGKCGLIRSAEHIGIALIGSSRVMTAWDPDLPDWQRNDVYNLAASGSFFYENVAVFDELLRHHQPEAVFFGIDPGDLTSDFDTRRLADFASSPLADGGFDLERELRYAVGISTLTESLRTLRRASRHESPKFTPRGLHRLGPEWFSTDQRQLLAALLNRRRPQAFPESLESGARLLPDKARLLHHLVETSHQRGIRLILVLHPSHFLTRLPPSGATPITVPRENEAILQLVRHADGKFPQQLPTPVWDFQGPLAWNCDPMPLGAGERMEHWLDFGHYTPEVGRTILARISGWPILSAEGQNYGTPLTLASLPVWRENYLRDAQSYLDGPGGRDLAWRQSLLHAAARH